jgi:sec-independent protein translocase protein TatC
MSVQVPTPPEEPQDDLRGQMSFLDHLEELRKRIINSLIAIGIAMAACWFFADNLFRIVARPIETAGVQLAMSKLTEGFNLELKLAMMSAVFVASPFLLAQLWLFIAPGLYKHERRYALPFVLFSSVLFVLGGLFGYFIAFPYAAQFLLAWGTKNMGLTPVIMASDYFDLFVTIELGLGIVFEIPAVIFILARIGLVSAGFLLRNVKYAILISFLLAAVITPTSDIPNMMIMAVPMIALYFLGIVVAFFFGKKRHKEPGD